MSSWHNQMEALIDSCRTNLGGVEVSYTQPAASPFTVTGIFESERRQEDASPGTFPILFVKLSDFAIPPAAGDVVTFESGSFVVIDPQNDGQGGVILVLQKR